MYKPEIGDVVKNNGYPVVTIDTENGGIEKWKKRKYLNSF